MISGNRYFFVIVVVCFTDLFGCESLHSGPSPGDFSFSIPLVEWRSSQSYH